MRVSSSGMDRVIVRLHRGDAKCQSKHGVLVCSGKRIGLSGLLFALLTFSHTAQSAPCAASGGTLSQARVNFSQQCAGETRKDCDYIASQWYCSNEVIGSQIPAGVGGSSGSTTTSNSGSSTGSGSSTAVCVDPDGDGYGWNGSTCRVPATGSTSASASGSSASSGSTSSGGLCLDPDGDGWGWNGASCRVSTSSSATGSSGGSSTGSGSSSSSGTASCPDPDGDGWGWRNGASCRASSSGSSSGTTSAGGSTSSSSVIRASDITDLVLLTGQSNALGANTTYDSTLDSPNDKVFAFTNNGWQRANLNQIWDRGWHPRNHPNTDPSNNLLLHFGKRVVSRDSSRVVGFILVSAPGAPISNWDYNGVFYNSVRTRVLDAINQLPHKSRLDGILWHQGETDADDNPLYGTKLYALIDNFRSENWFTSGRPFICGEIAKRGGVNNQLNRLNTDNDSSTACISAANVETKIDNSHFTAVGLREMGRRYGDQYYQMTR